MFTIMSISIAKADMNDLYKSRINPGIIAKLFQIQDHWGHQQEHLYIPVYGTDDNVI